MSERDLARLVRAGFVCGNPGLPNQEAARAEWLSAVDDLDAALTVDRVCDTGPKRLAAVALVDRSDGKMLCVWNRRYGGWSFPGGLVENGETPEQAMVRELREETGLMARGAMPVFDAPYRTHPGGPTGRGSHVHVFSVIVDWSNSHARETEEGCPVTWLTRDEFLKWSPFAVFYRDFFAHLDATGRRPGGGCLSGEPGAGEGGGSNG